MHFMRKAKRISCTSFGLLGDKRDNEVHFMQYISRKSAILRENVNM